MKRRRWTECLIEWLIDALISFGILLAATLLSLALSKIHDDNNTFSMSLYILAVALIARFTHGYIHGIVASLVSVLCVNTIFTHPFWEFNMSITGYPLTFLSMLLVSLIISALTSQIKRQEQLRYEMEAEKMCANLLRSVSHDLRTPLASILGASSVLMDADASANVNRDEMLRQINREAKWLIRVMENLLSVTRFSGGSVSLKKDTEVVEEIVGSSIVKFRRNNPTISISVTKPEEILLAPMDATLIEQVLLNLFENVVAHGENASHIEVTIARAGNHAVLSVEDDGVGFPDSLLKSVFDGRAMLLRSQPDGRRNMGIGLSVCRSIIRAHGGDITASNRARGGGCVKFWLPCEEEENHAY